MMLWAVVKMLVNPFLFVTGKKWKKNWYKVRYWGNAKSTDIGTKNLTNTICGNSVALVLMDQIKLMNDEWMTWWPCCTYASRHDKARMKGTIVHTMLRIQRPHLLCSIPICREHWSRCSVTWMKWLVGVFVFESHSLVKVVLLRAVVQAFVC